MSSARIRHYCLDRPLVPFIPLSFTFDPPTPLFCLYCSSVLVAKRLGYWEVSCHAHVLVRLRLQPRVLCCTSPQCLKCMLVLHISTLISFYVARLVAQQTGRLTSRDIGKDLAIRSGHTFPIIQLGGVCCSLVFTGTKGRSWSRAAGVVEEKHQQ